MSNEHAIKRIGGWPSKRGSDNGPPSQSRFNSPMGVAISHDGKSLLCCDSGSQSIRRIDLETEMTTTVIDGLSMPRAITRSDANKCFYFTDSQRIRRLDLDGKVTNIYPTTKAEARLSSDPVGICTRSRYLYVSDKGHCISRIDIETDELVHIAGYRMIFGFRDGIGIDARFFRPKGIAIDSLGNNLYVADNGNMRIRKITLKTGMVETLFSYADAHYRDLEYNAPSSVAVSLDGTIYFNGPGIITQGTALFRPLLRILTTMPAELVRLVAIYIGERFDEVLNHTTGDGGLAISSGSIYWANEYTHAIYVRKSASDEALLAEQRWVDDMRYLKRDPL